MRVYIVIPAHNEEKYIGQTLDSLCNQSLTPEKILVVNDNSTDDTEKIVKASASKFDFLDMLTINSSEEHIPGSKVIQAFNAGLNALDDQYDIICKFDADLIFPENYMATLYQHFENDPKAGMAGGFCYIQKGKNWVLENLTNKDHIRGALKAYRKDCFKAIGGLKAAMGWDTADELLAQYHGWKIITDKTLHVKHLKPTGKTYAKQAKYKQGEAFYRLRYGTTLALIASLKLAFLKKKPAYFFDYFIGYMKAKRNRIDVLVTKEEGAFIRKLRWQKIKQKLF
ncbi:glycosyltransferase [Aquimarina brevivitae]|uniref:Glycosyl transferase family 2 n=1 Tax=Aquimarina brevivitae TaxID=323412 RepID=A0A4Q7PI65_9FLAO|nr:glycosyltransferase family 2 protein [Aquimarina brevivitae]RZS99907.1 glycosyl transferase family 2 [Aquimarina brevivitae]